jgi:hypothetical protein
MTQQLTNLAITIDLEDERKGLRFYESIVTEAVDQVFTAFGENVKQVLYKSIEINFGIKRKEIPNRIYDFAESLEAIFGSAARLVQVKTIEKIQAKTWGFCYKSMQEEVIFTEYLTELRQYLTQHVELSDQS